MLSKAKLTAFRPQPWMIHAAGGAIVLAVALGFYSWFWAPTAADVAHRTGRMVHLHALMANNERIAADHRQLSERLAELRAAAASVRKRMPRRASTQDFIERATELANSLELKTELCTAAAPQEHPTHSQVQVTCRVNGSYDSVCRYLAAVDQFSQISKISTLEIDSEVNSQSYPVQVVFQLYYRRELSDTEVKRGAL
jgi:Tfp pilus assembly protein PilO